jgi:hypothetical protein
VIAHLEFTGPRPTPPALARLNAAASAIDRDVPTITAHGFDDARWRKPRVDLAVILGLCHAAGFPCRGHWHDDDHEPRRPHWVASVAGPFEDYMAWEREGNAELAGWIMATLAGDAG